MFEGIVTSIVNVINRPPSFQNKGVCFYSGAGSPSFSVSSVENKSPVYFCGDSKEENPRNFKFVMAERDKAVLEKVDTNVVDTLDFNDVVITDIRSSDVVLNKMSDVNMPSSYSGETIGQESLISPVHRDVNNVYSTAKMEAKCNAGSSSNFFAECTLNCGATSKLESVNSICVPFMTGSSSLAVSIEGHDFNCLLDSGAAVTAISAEVWHTYLSHAYPILDRPSPEGVTSVNGCRLATLGKSSMKFVIDSQVLPFEAHVIQDLAYDVILGRDFLQKFSFKIDFENGVVNFSPEADPLPFSDDHSNSTFEVSEDSSDNFISSVHASRTFVIPPQSEILVSGKLNSLPNVIGINGMIAPRSDLSHRYSVFGAAELVRVAEDGTIPVRIVNISSEPVKIYRRTK